MSPVQSSPNFDAEKFFNSLFEDDDKSVVTVEATQISEPSTRVSHAHPTQQKPIATHMVRAQANEQEFMPGPSNGALSSGWEKARAGFPVSLARSALFSVSKAGDEWLKDVAVPIPASKGIEMRYSGPQLNQHHALVFQALCTISEGATQDIVVPHGDILKLLGIQNYQKWAHDKIWSLINDMIFSHIDLDTARVRYKGGLIHSVVQDKVTGKVYIGLNHRLAGLFENELILESPEIKAAIGNGQLSLWLHSYISSHFKAFPIPVAELRRLCGYRRPMKKFRYDLKKAAEQLSSGENPLITSWSIDAEDRFVFEKRKTTVLMLSAEKVDVKTEVKSNKSDGAMHRAREQRAKVAL